VIELEEPIFFASAFEALFARALRGKMTPSLKDEMRKAGLDPDKPLKVAYPFKTWEDIVDAAGKVIYPGLDPSEAWFRLGQDFLDGFSATVIGKASVAFARLVGIDRVLDKFTHNLKSINNATEGVIELREKGRVHLKMKVLEKFRGKIHPSPPQVAHYLRGVLLGMLRSLNLQHPNVELIHSNREIREAVYELTWDER
jgi:uncharacterized protein (TIGR02265 family)